MIGRYTNGPEGADGWARSGPGPAKSLVGQGCRARRPLASKTADLGALYEHFAASVPAPYVLGDDVCLRQIMPSGVEPRAGDNDGIALLRARKHA